MVALSVPMGLDPDTNRSNYYRAKAPETFLHLPFSSLSPSLPVL